ncbi:MAG TPA: hypoxanthine phosphoribosyltransferase [Candidatus Eisenbacteria bacterium]|nr:hypoxanthine phosphoribosyltransferase [Candidatus Eisenbacteria bacterium]
MPTTAAKRTTRAKPGQRAEESLRILISHKRIRERVRELAQEIRRDFPNEPMHLVGVLKGSVLFLADLAREMGGEVSFDFISVSSYGKGMDSTGEVKMIKDLDVSIEGRSVLVVEDILDTGLTLRYLLRLFEERKPKHLRVAVLLDKAERRIADVRADYTGFVIPNEFVVGYGLDFDERYRNLPDVCVVRLGPRGKTKIEV